MQITALWEVAVADLYGYLGGMSVNNVMAEGVPFYITGELRTRLRIFGKRLVVAPLFTETFR
jgi:hypothetical protein